jgi:hypothetical protein
MLNEIWILLKNKWDDSESTRRVEEYHRIEEKHYLINDFYIKHGVYL